MEKVNIGSDWSDPEPHSHGLSMLLAPGSFTAPEAIADAPKANEPGARALEPEKLRECESHAFMD